MKFRALFPLAAMAFTLLLAGCYPPSVQYPYTPMVTERRATLQKELVALLPADQQGNPIAKEEAAWLADTAYKAAAAISRVNDSNFPGWAGNTLINARMQDRGLCWHYQHDMYRELRRRPLHFFRIGCCVRDFKKLTEHNCVYVAPIAAAWPHAWVLDAWMWNGRLKVNKASELDQDDWTDAPKVCHRLSAVYREGHDFPVEHWYQVRSYTGEYAPYWTDTARRSMQYQRMYDNILRGKTTHPGKLTNY